MSGAAKLSDIEDIYELSPMQLGMLFQSLLTPGSGVFVEQLVIRLSAPFDPAAFERAWSAVVERTPVLRTSFHWGDMDKPVQVVHRGVSAPVEHLDWRDAAPAEQSQRLSDYLARARQVGFELDTPPLTRVALIRTSPTDTWFVWHFHHILLDGWSSQLLLQELAEQYRALSLGQAYEAPRREPFSTYVGWLQARDQIEAEEYWQRTLQGFTAPTPVVTGRPMAPRASDGNDGTFVLNVSASTSEALRTFAREQRLTLNTLIQGSWAFLLSRYTGRDDVVYGTVVSGRPGDLPGVEDMIGLFMNTVPVRVAVSPDAFLLPWLKALQSAQIEAAQYQYVSTLQVQRWSQLPQGTRLFDTVLVFENLPLAGLEPGDAEAESLDFGRTDVAITVMVIPSPTLRLKFLNDRQSVDDATTARMARHFEVLLAQLPILANPRLGALSVLPPEERRRMLTEWNATEMTAGEEPLMSLLEQQVARAPDAVAFIDGTARVTTREVHERSNRLAEFLLRAGVGPASTVGVCLERSVDAAVAFLAILKARAVYLPLDPAYPEERLAYMVEDAGAALVLVKGRRPPSGRASVVDLAADWPDIERCDPRASFAHAAPNDLAYVIYTSGSTGTPKGVGVEHRTILNRLWWMWRAYPFAGDEVCVMRTPLSFVDSFWEMLGGLLQGVPTVIVSEAVGRDPQALCVLLAAQRVSRMWLVPSYLEMLLDACPDLGRRLPALKGWWSGGEPLTAELYRRFRRSAPAATLYNVYGTSETWDGTVFDPAGEEDVGDSVPIGRPIANLQAYVLDASRQPVPVGTVGELYIGGAGLARGYLNRETLTRERFIAHPFSGRPGERLYRTGDLARFRPDGIIEYVGRNDLQINLRGFRIEPAEVEAALNTHPSVRECVVVGRKGASGEAQLVAYVIAADAEAGTEALLAHARARLPAIMTPAKVVWVSALPRTPSGKRDRARLPDPEQGGTNGAAVGSAPTTALERALAAQFCEILGVASVGVHQDFFGDLGGHSLLATRLISRLRDALGIELPLRMIFDAPSVSRLAAAVAPLLHPVDDDATTTALLAELASLPDEEVASLLDTLQIKSDEVLS